MFTDEHYKNLEHRLDLIYRVLYEMNQRINNTMTALDDLNAAVAALTTSISAEIAALTAAQASNNDAGVETAVANLNSLNTQLQSSIAPKTPVAPTTTPAT